MNLKLKLPRATVLALVTAGALGSLAAAPCLAQSTGVSHPEDMPNDVNDPPPAPPPLAVAGEHYVKPSPDIPVAAAAPAPAPAPSRYSASTSDRAPDPALAVRRPLPRDPEDGDDSNMVVTDDPNSGVVTEVAVGPNALPSGTALRAELQSPVSTLDTHQGAHFIATLTSDVSRNQVVLLPAGTLITGRVTRVHGGHAISGPAAIRLQPDKVSLPDGTSYRLDAEVIDLDHSADSHVNSEGTIVDNTHPKAALAALGLTTSAAAVAGAVVGGGVGAAVGAGIAVGVGTVWYLKRDRQETLPQGTAIVFGLNNTLQLTPVAH